MADSDEPGEHIADQGLAAVSLLMALQEGPELLASVADDLRSQPREFAAGLSTVAMMLLERLADTPEERRRVLQQIATQLEQGRSGDAL